MSEDPFSDVLRFADAETVVSGGFTAGGRWAIRFPIPGKIKFFGVAGGACWLCIDGEDTPLRVHAGDVFLLSAHRPFVLAGDPATAPVDAADLFADGAGRITPIGEGDDACFLIGGHVRLNAAGGALLSDVLPPLIHIPAAASQAGMLQWLLNQLIRESAAELPGAALAMAQLAQLMFVHVLRAHLHTSPPMAAGWLRAVVDPRLAPALRLIHGDPGRAWRLDELAKAAAMSRTTFALYFKATAGVAPVAYLTEWRMRLAKHALRERDVTVGQLARSLGYASESAFSNAFKRVTGTAPQRFRQAIEAKHFADTPIAVQSL